MLISFYRNVSLRRKQMKKFILIGVTALAALGIMSGCSSNNKKEASSPLTFWYMGDGDQGVKPIIDKFTKETGVAVKIQSIPWSASRDKLLTAVAAKNGPDVAQIGTSFMSEFVDAGALTDISDFDPSILRLAVAPVPAGTDALLVSH